jgi:putative acetyltransferase
MMINIRPIHADDVQAVKQVLLKVGYGIFGWNGTLEESIAHFESSGDLNDIDNFKTEYIDRDGIFLTVLDDEKVIGSGAIRKIDKQTAEVKRLWLLESYHGQQAGYQVLQRLFDFARQKGYIRVWLQTSPEQTRAIAFYQKIGFHEIACYNDDTHEISMEIYL